MTKTMRQSVKIGQFRFVNSADSFKVRLSVKVGSRETDEALKPLLEGNGSREFFESAQHVLERSPNYSQLLDDARAVGFDATAVNAGFIAGLRAASELFNLNYEFLIEA